MPRTAVLMSAYNAEHTIEVALRSTLASLGRDGQVAVLDDGSSDRTSEVAARVAATLTRGRVIVTRSEENLGSGAARLRLFQSTDSAYVANMDADDICLPWRFAMQRRLIKGADFVFSTGLRLSPGGRTVRPMLPVPSTPESARRELLLANPFPHSTMLARRSALERVGAYRTLRRAQDYDLWLRAALDDRRFRKTAVPTIIYRTSLTQVSQEGIYSSQVGADPQLGDAYLNLLASLTGGPRADSRAVILEQQSNIIAQLPFLKRLYYGRLSKRGLLFQPTLGNPEDQE